MKKLIIVCILLFFLLAFGGSALADRADGQISWIQDGINTTEYELKYGKDPYLLVSTILTFPVNQKSTVIEGLDWETTYYFMVKSKGPGGETDSDIISAETPVQPIGAPAKAVVTVNIVTVDEDGNIKSFTLTETVEESK